METHQPSWRGKGLHSRKDSKSKYVEMVGSSSMLYIPISVETNKTYIIEIEAAKKSGNGIMFCNIYSNQNFDFPHSNIVIDTQHWAIYKFSISTKDFPKTVPMTFRVWRGEKGTGSIYIRRIFISLADNNDLISVEKRLVGPVEKLMVPTIVKPRPPGTSRPFKKTFSPRIDKFNNTHGQKFSEFENNGKNILFIYDDYKNYNMFDELATYGFNIKSINASNNIIEITKNYNPVWIHFHIRNPLLIDLKVIENLRKNNSAIITFWTERYLKYIYEIFDNIDYAFCDDEDEIFEGHKNNIFNIQLWDPGINIAQNIEKSSDNVFVYIEPRMQDKNNILYILNNMNVNFISIEEEDFSNINIGNIVIYLGQLNQVLLELLATGATILAEKNNNIQEWFENNKEIVLFNTEKEFKRKLFWLIKNKNLLNQLNALNTIEELHNKQSRLRELAFRLQLLLPLSSELSKERLNVEFNKILCIVPKEYAHRVQTHNNKRIMYIFVDDYYNFIKKAIRFMPDLILFYINIENDFWHDVFLNIKRFLPTTLFAYIYKERIDNLSIIKKFDFICVQDNNLYCDIVNNGCLQTVMLNNILDCKKSNIATIANYLYEYRKKFLSENIDITIFMGTYNRLRKLQAAVNKTLASKKDKKIEIIINDAGSTDGTIEWLKSKKDNIIVPILSGKRTSFTQAFNESLMVARGKYIAWLSDDIEPQSDAIFNMCNLMNAISSNDMGAFFIKNSWDSNYEMRLDNKNKLCPTVGCMHTETLQKYNGLNSDYPYYSQDSELDYRVMRLGGKIISCPAANVYHHCLEDSFRRDNCNKNTIMRGTEKFDLINERYVVSEIAYPIFLLKVNDGVDKLKIKNIKNKIKNFYSNVHILIKDTTECNNIIRKYHKLLKYDVIIEIDINECKLLFPKENKFRNILFKEIIK